MRFYQWGGTVCEVLPMGWDCVCDGGHSLPTPDVFTILAVDRRPLKSYSRLHIFPRVLSREFYKIII